MLCMSVVKAISQPEFVPAPWLHGVQEPDDDGGSPIVYYQVEVRPRCAAARRNLADDWSVYYQVTHWLGRTLLVPACYCLENCVATACK